MKRRVLFGLLVLVFLPWLAWGQMSLIPPPGATVSTGLTDSADLARLASPNVFTGNPQTFPDGSAASPSLRFTSETTGSYLAGAATYALSITGTQRYTFTPANFTLLGSTSANLILSHAIARVYFGTGFDAILARFAAANLQLGDTASATPVAQTFSAQDGVGTDIAGQVFTLRASRGTGAGAVGTIVLAASAAPLGTGTTLQTAVTHLTVGGGQVLVPDGTAAAPGMAFIGAPTTGLYRAAAAKINVALGGVNALEFGTSASIYVLGMGDDAFLHRFAAANFQLGNTASATPVAQTLSAQDGVGTNIAGTAWTLRANRATGSGTPGTIVLAASAAALGSGTTLQTAVAHQTIGGGWTIFGSVLFAALGAPANGAVTFCSNCDPPTLVDQTCTSAGTQTGSIAVRTNGAWKCIS